MPKSFFTFAIIATLFLSGFTTYQATQWKLGEGYKVEFSSEDPNGVFKTMTGEIVFDEAKPEASSFDMSIDVSSINTGNGMKNKHAVSENWFNAEAFPSITFKSSKISKTESGYETVGMLTIMETSKEISIPFTFKENTFAGTFKVNRHDYGLGGPKGASAELELNISVPVTK